MTRLDPALGRARVDPAQIDQVLMNLAVNARDAMPGGGTLALETAEPRRAGDRPSLRGAHRARHRARHGRATRAQVFEPFFTTKAGSGRHRPGPLHGLRHRAAERRPDRGRERARARLLLPDPAPPRRTARAPRPRQGARRPFPRAAARPSSSSRTSPPSAPSPARCSRRTATAPWRGERGGGARPRGAPPGPDRPAPDRRRHARPLRPRPGRALRRRPARTRASSSCRATRGTTSSGAASRRTSPHVLPKPFSADAALRRGCGSPSRAEPYSIGSGTIAVTTRAKRLGVERAQQALGGPARGLRRVLAQQLPAPRRRPPRRAAPSSRTAG